MDEVCLFCKIVAGELPAEIVYEDELTLVFRDIHPQREVHLLAIPKTHIVSLETLSAQDDALIAHMARLLPKLAADHGLKTGFRTIINTGPGGGQEIFHLHFHLLGGKRL